MTTKFI